MINHRPTSLALTALATTVAGCSETSTTASSTLRLPSTSPLERSVGRGSRLYIADHCFACHSTDGARGEGPSFKGLSNRVVTLAKGRRLRATSSFLRRSIVAPNSARARGYPRELMLIATQQLDLPAHPTDVKALEFIEAIR